MAEHRAPQKRPLFARGVNKVKRSIGGAVQRLTGDVPAAPELKRQRVRDLAKRFSSSIFVETGTYQGDMVEAVHDIFERVISIEIFEPLYKKACERFALRTKIQLLHGNSGELMPKVVEGLTAPALFWLDGHYSGDGTGRSDKDTPIEEELTPILSDRRFAHVVLIDDARLFNGKNSYPKIPELARLIQRLRPGSRMLVENDAVGVFPA